MYSYTLNMDRKAIAISADLRFGVAVPDGGDAPPVRAGLSTAEFSMVAWRRLGDAWPCDLSLRLGGAFVDPQAQRGDYVRALSECRILAEVLLARGRLSALLLEFPPSFSYQAVERRHLDRILGDLGGLPLATAFLNGEWYSSRVIEGLKKRGVALCLLDLPSCESVPPRVDIATASLVYMKCVAGQGPVAWISRLEAASALAESVRVIFEAESVIKAAKAAEALSLLWAARRRVGTKAP